MIYFFNNFNNIIINLFFLLLFFVFIFILFIIFLSLYFTKKLLKDKKYSVYYTIKDGLNKGEFGEELLSSPKIHFFFKKNKSKKIYGQIFIGDFDKIIFFYHGVTWTLYGMYKYILPFIKNNWTCILIDSKAHGLTYGDFPSYGFYEKYDFKCIVDYFISIFTKLILKGQGIKNEERKIEANKGNRIINEFSFKNFKKFKIFKNFYKYFEKDLFIDNINEVKFLDLILKEYKNINLNENKEDIEEKNENAKEKKILFGLFGESMGAAIVSQTVDILENKPDFVILNSTFSSLSILSKNILLNTIKNKFISNFVYIFSRIFIKILARFDIEDVNPIEYILKIDLPVMLIHSKNDPLIPFDMAYEIYKRKLEKMKIFEKEKIEKKKIFLEIFDCNEHAREIYSDEEKYWDSIFSFISIYYKS